MVEQLKTKKQYNLINAIKIIAAFFVVTIHCQFPGVFGSATIAVARFAVPFFFMISGFFCCYANMEILSEKIKGKAFHIFKIIIISFPLYFILAIVRHIDDVPGYLKRILSIKSVIAFAFFNNVPFAEFLWFLPALIYSYGAFYIISKICKNGKINKSFFLIPLLLLSGVIFREVTFSVSSAPGFLDGAFIYRNWLFIGFPFFLLGCFIKLNLEKLKKISNAALACIMAAGTAEAVAVSLFHKEKSIYIGTAVAVFGLFVFAVKNEEKMRVPHIASMGAKYSLYIYVFHIFVKDVILIFSDGFPAVKRFFDVLSPIYPLYIFLITVIISIIYVKIKIKISKIKHGG